MRNAVIVCTIAALLSWHAQGSGAESELSSAAVKKALTPDLIVLENERFVEGDERLVVVVGENHASVKTQIQLANLTTRLLDQNLVQAILVEGSSGAFDVSSFLRDQTKLSMSGAELRAFWRQQLEAGRIAGYEYVALTRPGIDIAGVEDMGAKARYEVGFQSRAYQHLAESYNRGATALEQDFNSLREKGKGADVQLVRSSLDEFKAARTRFAHVPGEIAQKLEPLGPPQAELMQVQNLVLPLYHRMNSWTPSYSDFETWIGEAKVLYQRLKPILEKMDSSSGITESSLSFSQKQDLRELNRLAERISSFKSAHKTDLDEMERLMSRFSRLSEQVEESQKTLEPFLKQVEGAATEVEDSFFVAANALESLARGTGQPRPKSMSFFREESERERKSNTAREKPFMVERDQAMVAGTVQYLQAQAKQRVLLIVGYAHLPGIIENLSSKNISFISGKLEASERDIEPWEGEAWELRKRANVPVFFALKRQLKELSPLLSDIWKKEQLARLEYLRQIYQAGSALKPAISGLAGDSRIFEKIGNEDRVVMVGRFPFDRNADFGAHVLDQGIVPTKEGEFYRVFDRGVAKELVEKLSDSVVDFVYHFKTARSPEETATYRLMCSAGDKSLGDFMANPPSRAKYEVLFGEPDEVDESGLPVSPLQGQLRGGSTGGTPPPGGRPPWTSAFADPGDPRRPALLRTINPRRAHHNLIAIERQQPSRIGDVAFFEDADLPILADKLRFTPSAGDNAHMVVLTARNTAEFRASIRKAADAKLLKGKQVALITCGDAFTDTAVLREDLLRADVLMVWANDRQVTPEGARRLRDEVKKSVETLPPEQRKTIEQLMNHSLQNWRKADPNDPGHRAFLRAGPFVDARSCNQGLRFPS